MDFFSHLATKISGYSLQLTVSLNDEGKLTVMIYPKVSDKTEVQDQIVPLTLTGTPAEMDAEFFTRLGTPLDKTKQIADQIKAYEKSLEKAAEKSAGKKTDIKTPVKTETKPGLFDKKEESKVEVKKEELVEKAPVEPTSVEDEIVPDNVDPDTGEIEPISAASLDTDDEQVNAYNENSENENENW